MPSSIGQPIFLAKDPLSFYRKTITIFPLKVQFLIWEWVGGERHPGEYVSFRIVAPQGDDLIDLHVEDFCDQDEEKILHNGWNKQMERLASLLH